MENLNQVEVYNSLEAAKSFHPVATTGIFDGLHLGHQKLLTALKSEARLRQAPSMVITFWPHPYVFFHSEDSSFKLLMSLEEKEHKIAELGIDVLVILPFDQKMADMTAKEFIDQVLIKALNIQYLIIGDDHRFGKNREGSFDYLQKIKSDLPFDLSDLDSLNSGEVRVSSTFIRSCLLAGDLESANKLLGHPYFMFGMVQKGNRIGSQIGFPTANIACCEGNKQIPQDGVYVVEVEWNGSVFGGMLNIGTRPTVENTGRKSIEVHMFDHEGDLYGEKLKVSFIRKLREEMRFNNLEELRNQLNLDRESALSVLQQKMKK